MAEYNHGYCQACSGSGGRWVVEWGVMTFREGTCKRCSGSGMQPPPKPTPQTQQKEEP